MDEHLGAKGIGLGEVDWLSNLPESLLCKMILLNLPTKDVVKTSVLSSRWRHLWRYVPALSLASSEFQDLNTFLTFVDSFLHFNSESRLQYFNLEYNWRSEDGVPNSHLTWWIHSVLERKVQHLHLLDRNYFEHEQVEIPLQVYTCESLLSLELERVTLPNPEFVSLPHLKALHLDHCTFATNELAFENFISACPLLESLSLVITSYGSVNVLRVCSKSLLSFTHFGIGDEHLLLVIDAPRLEYLKLEDFETDSCTINHPGSLVKLHIDMFSPYDKIVNPIHLSKKKRIRSFLVGISSVKDMEILNYTLEVIYHYSRHERLPVFPNLSSLTVDFDYYSWEALRFFLQSCPNLKSLALCRKLCIYHREDESLTLSSLPGPYSCLQALELVEMLMPMEVEAIEMKILSYFLENAPILKKLIVCLDGSRKKEATVILKKLLTIRKSSRLSSSCQVVLRYSTRSLLTVRHDLV